MSETETSHAVDPRTDAPKCSTCRTDLCVEGDHQGGWVCRRCDRPVREADAIVDEPVPEGETVYYLPGHAGNAYHHSRDCINLIQSDRELQEWTPEVAHRSGREPCGTCAGGVSDDE